MIYIWQYIILNFQKIFLDVYIILYAVFFLIRIN